MQVLGNAKNGRKKVVSRPEHAKNESREKFDEGEGTRKTVGSEGQDKLRRNREKRGRRTRKESIPAKKVANTENELAVKDAWQGSIRGTSGVGISSRKGLDRLGRKKRV